MRPKDQPQYSASKSIRYMFSLAWRHQKSVLCTILVIVAAQIGVNMAQLYIAPKILEQVETATSLSKLFATVGLFTGLIFFLTAVVNYTSQVALYSRVNLRTNIIAQINAKSFATSYPNCFDQERKNFLGEHLRKRKATGSRRNISGRR